ncbi:MAG: ATP-binding cassette domain-containing protein, partial [Gemmatimonadetes bacterium]|nr:ATP-binding cassette domain-containing protein [Gemmatimonadota bacterium]
AERFDLGEVLDRTVGGYSTGMRLRLGLAVAFAARPRLLLLDEPLAGLDPGGRRVLASALAERRAAGGTAVISTHDPLFAGELCDRVAFLVEGACAAAKSPDAFLDDLGSETRIEVRFSEPPDRTTAGPAPASCRETDWSGDVLTVSVREPRTALAEVLAWVAPAGAVRAVDIREPDLGEAFFRITGRRLGVEAA